MFPKTFVLDITSRAIYRDLPGSRDLWANAGRSTVGQKLLQGTTGMAFKHIIEYQLTKCQDGKCLFRGPPGHCKKKKPI